ncbi:MAG: NAD(P) transhydrogenase subunit alpha [Microlunatus sp.]|nr:NAD(P) transhydrogenase subunit alpha [Microlunatus sp.]MDN5769327.1 NAD(P) transhydrogenase subunit alpha [Microlunatus sp.]
MRIAVARESEPGETRVALVPELVGRLTGAGYEVAIEPGAGRGALLEDEAYAAAGATVSEHALHGAGLVLSVQPVSPEALRFTAPRAATISFLFAGQRADEVATRQAEGLTTFAMEKVPRISRAQSMDALSSQALVAGYRGAIVAAGRLREFFPLSMTAAGTVRPAEVLVLGAGVAGLQALATCRRLGAVVKGYDVRAAAAEEIASLGATPIDLNLPSLEGAGGYAREMTEERAQQQRELLAPHVAAAHAVITTAAVPGLQAPILVTNAMVAGMRPGSVVVDLAADSGGNVEGVAPGRVVNVSTAAGTGSVQLWGGSNVPSQMPAPASRLYAQNVLNVVLLMTRDQMFDPDFADEIVAGMCITRPGGLGDEPETRPSGSEPVVPPAPPLEATGDEPTDPEDH